MAASDTKGPATSEDIRDHPIHTRLMTMAGISRKLADKHFHNWLKTGLALYITKQGLENVVDNEINKFHADCLKGILTPAQIKNNEVCSECRTENIVPCHCRGLCFIKAGKCSFHNSPENLPRTCPKHICDQLKDIIRKCHKYSFPSWKNTFGERWCQSPWEIAKCFMPPEGYYTANSIAETDLNGVLSVMLNFTPIAQHVIEQNCNEAREVSRRFRHSPNLAVNDKEMSQQLDILIGFLTCTNFLGGKQSVMEAVQKIRKLKVDALTVSTQDITKVLEIVIEDLTKRSLRSIDQKQMQMLQEANNAVTNLQVTTRKGISEIFSAKDAALKEVASAKRAAVDEITKETKRQKNEDKPNIDKMKSDSMDAINNAAKVSVTEIKEQSTATLTQEREKEYIDLKQSLCEDIITFYEEEYTTIPVSPLVPEQNAHLLHFFVQPNMELAEWTIEKTTKSIPIHSYHDIFMNNTSVCRNIYISAQAGVGKTTFAKRLCTIWCYAKRGQEIDGHDISESDIDIVKYFDFLFFIPLRNCQGNECTVEAMIHSQVISHLSWSGRYKKWLLERLLHEDKTLIILEGLDEWSHPSDSDCSIPAHIPHRISRQRCSVLSTTRPWKMHEARISNSKVDKYIKMIELGSSSKEKLIHNVVNSLTGEEENEHSVKKFLEEMNAKDMSDIASTPVLLIQLICLWIDGRTLSASKCNIYFNIIDFMLQVGVERIDKLGKITLVSKINRALDDHYSPRSVNKYEHCQKYLSFLLVVGELAFKSLFSERKESSLVIKSTVVEKLLTENELWCCLQIGLLTRNKRIRVSENLYTYSFIHKTFQEFFAALYIQAFTDVSFVSDTVLKVCNSLGSILEMSHVFVFLCGLRPKSMQTFSEKIRDVVSSDSFTQHFRHTVLFVNSERNENQTLLKEFQNMCIECTKEFNTEHEQVHLEDLFFDQDIANNDYCGALSRLRNSNKGRVMSVTIEDTNLSLLHKSMTTFHVKEMQILGRIFIISELSGDDFVTILTESVKTLKCLSICSRKRKHGRMVPEFTFFSDVHLNTFQNMSNLESLVLECFAMSHTVLVNFIGWITHMVNMKQLGLLIKCNDHKEKCPGFTLDLSKHSQLKSLELCALRVTNVYINTDSLQDSHIGSLSTDGLSNILDCITVAKKLRAIEFYDITKECSIEKFLKTLKLLDFLEVIELNKVELGQREMELSQAMGNLKDIMLVDVCISCAALRNVIERVDTFRNPVRVMLWHCEITPFENFENLKEEIRLSESYKVIQDWKDSDSAFMFTFKTLKRDNSDRGYPHRSSLN